MVYVQKLIVCGSGGVGKTSIVRRYVESKFSAGYLITLGMEPSNRKIDITNNGKTFTVIQQIWDVAGQKRFQSLSEVYFKGASGALLVFDLTNSRTLTDLRGWQSEIIDKVGSIPMFLLGNKSDLKDHISVRKRDIKEIIHEYGVSKYLITSALLDQCVTEAFHLLSTEILRNEKVITIKRKRRSFLKSFR
ncbi:MAG: Rab family GTPase [Candidatus Hodarchaeales archaeon]|jgi:small GTP-binding protein